MKIRSMFKDVKRIALSTVIILGVIFGVGYFAEQAIGENSPLTTPGTPNLTVGATTQNTVQVSVNWTVSTGDGTTVVKGYEISRSTNVNFPTTDTTTVVTTGDVASFEVNGDTATYSDNVPLSQQKYYYMVRAYSDNNVYSAASGVSGTYVAGPKIESSTPENNSTGDSIKPLLQVKFDQDISPETVNASSFVVRPSGGQDLSGTVVTYDAASHTANLSFTGTLLPSTGYVLEVTTGVKNTSGFTLPDAFRINFTTGKSTNYPHGAYSVITSQCSNCHKSHTAVGAQLLNTSNQNSGCFVCHNGTQANRVEQDYFGQNAYKTTGHMSIDPNTSQKASSQCSECHTPHGGSQPKLLTGQYNMDASATKKDYTGSQFNSCSGTPGNTSCHDAFNNLTASSNTKFVNNTSSKVDLHYLHLVKAGVDNPNKGNAVCFECHRPHGPVPAEIQGAVDQNSPLLAQAHQVGFPSTSTVLPAFGNSNPIFVLNPGNDTVGGGCILSCHGVTHDVNTPSSSDVVDSRYDKTPH